MLNVAIVMGRLVADPELRHTPNDVAVTSFTLAVDRAYVKSGAERQTDFIDIVAWRGTAEFICRYFRKGQMMAVHGSIQTRTYTDKDGNKRKAFEILADDVSFADSKRNDSGGNTAAYSAPAAPAPAPTVNEYQGFGGYNYEPEQQEFEEISGDDDFPF